MLRLPIVSLFLLLFSAFSAAAEDQPVIIQRPHFVYHFDNPTFIQTADSALENARTRLIDILNDSLDYRPAIYIPDNLADFKAVVGAAFPDWGAAAALPYRHLIAIKSPASYPLGRSLRELLQHEYTHLALEHRLFHVQPPRWLDEGLAMYISSEWGWGENINMTRAVLFNSLIPLKEIKELNRFSEGKALIAYSESYLAVKYLLDSYGRESFNIFLDKLKDNSSVDQALMASVGSGYDGFENEFFEFLRKKYTLMTFFSDTLYFWLALAVLVVIGFLIGFRKKRKFYKKWEDEDKYESKDFDYGDPDNIEEEDDEDEDQPWR